jgi:hypothetical protein
MTWLGLEVWQVIVGRHCPTISETTKVHPWLACFGKRMNKIYMSFKKHTLFIQIYLYEINQLNLVITVQVIYVFLSIMAKRRRYIGSNFCKGI